ncbi:MAG TPA: carbohydrate kinase, partial [Rhodobacteraceae bacterium]|nr:carbohydrate kinase [Paracoccaceae bacterium]
MILCCGEALIDMLPDSTKAGDAAFVPRTGGAVFNTAIALGRLGVETGFYSGLSQDFFGDMLRDALQDSHVDSTLATISNHPATLAFVRLVDGQAQYTFYDENTAGRMLTPKDLPHLPDNIRTLFFGGISLVSEPCGSTYEALMMREAERITMLDPNIRPDFITNEAPYRARLDRMMAQADIVKLSDEDLHWLFGEGDLQQMAQDVIAKGATIVFVTEGAKGAWAYTKTHHVFVPAKAVKVVDTIGAGDTFNAGVLASMSEQELLEKSALQAIGKPALTAVL